MNMKGKFLYLYHGSPRKGIKFFSLSDKHRITMVENLAEGIGIYCTEEFDVATCYARGGSIYTVEVDLTKCRILDITLIENIKLFINKISQAIGYNILNVRYVKRLMEDIQAGDRSFYRLNQDLNTILANDELFLGSEAAENYHYEKKMNIKIEQMMNQYDCVKYLDFRISNSPLYIFKKLSCLNIIDEQDDD